MSEEKKKKRSKKRAALVVFASAMAVSINVWAWFSISNRARVENLSLIADHQGNLQIADDMGNGPGTYSYVIFSSPSLTIGTGLYEPTNWLYE